MLIQVSASRDRLLPTVHSSPLIAVLTLSTMNIPIAMSLLIILGFMLHVVGGSRIHMYMYVTIEDVIATRRPNVPCQNVHSALGLDQKLYVSGLL